MFISHQTKIYKSKVMIPTNIGLTSRKQNLFVSREKKKSLESTRDSMNLQVEFLESTIKENETTFFSKKISEINQESDKKNFHFKNKIKDGRHPKNRNFVHYILFFKYI